MSFHGAVRMVLVAWTHRRADESTEGRKSLLSEIPPGRFEAWGRESSRRPPVAAGPGSACRTADGRDGRLVEVREQGRTTLVCTPT
jgi:hypothetical protein